jgi:hypothetical protein
MVGLGLTVGMECTASFMGLVCPATIDVGISATVHLGSATRSDAIVAAGMEFAPTAKLERATLVLGFLEPEILLVLKCGSTGATPIEVYRSAYSIHPRRSCCTHRLARTRDRR